MARIIIGISSLLITFLLILVSCPVIASITESSSVPVAQRIVFFIICLGWMAFTLYNKFIMSIADIRSLTLSGGAIICWVGLITALAVIFSSKDASSLLDGLNPYAAAPAVIFLWGSITIDLSDFIWVLFNKKTGGEQTEPPTA